MRLAIIGTGYVGLTSGVCLASLGHDVICVDIVPERVASINEGKTPFYEPGLDSLLASVLANQRLRVTSDLRAAVVASEVTMITVGTPQKDGVIDLTYVTAAARAIGAVLRDVNGYHVVAVKSTVVPGTTDTCVRNALEEAAGRLVGDFGLCMNPEFLREGSAVDDFNRPDRIVVGQWDDQSGKKLAEIYEPFECPRIFTTLRNAEMIKYASNSLLATLVSFSNEIAELCEVTPGADVESVMSGVHLDRRLSPVVNGERISPGILSFLRAGCGFGGSCLPKDLNALRNYGRERAVKTRLLDAVTAINSERPAHLIDLAEQALGSLDGSTVAVLGLAFKPGTDDLRDSPALAVIDRLLARGALVRVYDPMFNSKPKDLELEDSVVFCNTLEQALTGADAACVVTAWPEFVTADWLALHQQMKQAIVIDGRNLLRAIPWPENVTYLTIGQSVDKKRVERKLTGQ